MAKTSSKIQKTGKTNIMSTPAKELEWVDPFDVDPDQPNLICSAYPFGGVVGFTITQPRKDTYFVRTFSGGVIHDAKTVEEAKRLGEEAWQSMIREVLA